MFPLYVSVNFFMVMTTGSVPVKTIKKKNFLFPITLNKAIAFYNKNLFYCEYNAYLICIQVMNAIIVSDFA